MFLLAFLSLNSTFGQEPPKKSEFTEEVLPASIEQEETDGDLAGATFQEDQETHVIDINQLTEHRSEALGFCTEAEIHAIQKHIEEVGRFISIFELQAVEGISLERARQLIPHFTIKPVTVNYGNILKSAFETGVHRFVFRYQRSWPLQKGYLTDSPSYEGGADGYIFRYRFNGPGVLQAGFTAKKDPGEAFFTGSNKQGFDSYQGFLQLNKISPWLPQFILGDMRISFGQGLMQYGAWGAGKSSWTTLIRKSAPVLKPNYSISEIGFIRGGGAQFKFNKQYSAVIFGGLNSLDAPITNPDSVDYPDLDEEVFTSISESGLHRTNSEIENEKSIRQYNAGGQLSYTGNRFKIGLNSIYRKYSKPYLPSNAPYQKFRPTGKQTLHYGADHLLELKYITLFGEVSVLDGGGLALLEGAMLSLDPKFDIACMYRNYAADHVAFQPLSFGDSREATNEKGFYTGFQWKPTSRWLISSYVDLWKHPWLTFTSDFPQRGVDYLLKVQFSKRKKWDIYYQGRWKEEDLNQLAEISPLPGTTVYQRIGNRLHGTWTLGQGFTFRARLEHQTISVGKKSFQGSMIYQDILYKPLGKRISANLRFAVFNTDGYESRIYTYESDVLYSYAIKALFGKGSRMYLNIRYLFNNAITLEARYAMTRYQDQIAIGSGTSEVQGDTQHEVKLQLRYVIGDN